MIYLGVDPGYRNMGLALVNDDEVMRVKTMHNGSIKDWQEGIPTLLGGIRRFLDKQPVDAAGVEMISWYGKRRGSLQLAHLAGACVGYLLALNIDHVEFFSPKEVKASSLKNPVVGYDEHQNDALSLCRLVAAEY